MNRIHVYPNFCFSVLSFNPITGEQRGSFGPDKSNSSNTLIFPLQVTFIGDDKIIKYIPTSLHLLRLIIKAKDPRIGHPFYFAFFRSDERWKRLVSIWSSYHFIGYSSAAYLFTPAVEVPPLLLSLFVIQIQVILSLLVFRWYYKIQVHSIPLFLFIFPLIRTMDWIANRLFSYEFRSATNLIIQLWTRR